MTLSPNDPGPIHPAPNDPAPNDPVRAGLWMIGAILSFSLMAIAARALAPELDTFEIMLFRSALGIAIVLAMGAATGRLGQITRRRLGLHTLRNISHFAGQNLWFFALTAAPLAQVIALEFTTPLWVLILSPLLLNERLRRWQVLAAIVGFGGVLIVVRPWTGFGGIGTITAALAAIGFAGAYIATKLLTRSETTLCILFYLVAMQCVMGVVCAGWDGDIAWPSAALWPWVLLVAICGLTAHFSITTALTLAPASVVGPFDFARLPVIALIGYVLYQESIDIWVILGAIMIFAANYVNISLAQKRG